MAFAGTGSGLSRVLVEAYTQSVLEHKSDTVRSDRSGYFGTDLVESGSESGRVGSPSLTRRKAGCSTWATPFASE